jgi:flagellar hook-basal body complex protein FliE
MTSISATSSSAYLSPLQKLQDELQAELKSGAIGSSDQDALSSALTDIDSSLQTSRASDQAGGTKPSPDGLKSKIDDLIAGEVSSGKLTSDQATELQGVFKAAFAGGAGGPGGAGGAHGPHGGHGGPPPADSSSSADGTDSSSGATSADDMLKQFLQSLQDSLTSSSSSSYSATGSSAAAGNSTSSFSALLIDYQT